MFKKFVQTEFEEWFKNRFPNTWRDAQNGEQSAMMYRAHSYEAFKCSRELLCLELLVDEYFDEFSGQFYEVIHPDNMRQVLDKAGVKYK